MGYRANRSQERSCPPPDALLQAYYAGRFGDPADPAVQAGVNTLLAEHGIYWPANGANTSLTADTLALRGQGWAAFADLAKPMLDWQQALATFRRQTGDVMLPDLQDMLARQGITDPRWQRSMIWLGNTFSAGEIVSAYWKGLLPGTPSEQAAALRQWLMAAGYTEDAIAAIMAALGENTIGIVQAIALANRGLIDQTEYGRQLALQGVSPAVIPALSRLAYQIPGPSDLVRFAVREVWDQSVVDEFGYDADFPPEFAAWLAKQGFDWQGTYDNHGDVPVPGGNWAVAYWRAHWQAISPGQAYDMLHRLRPGREFTWLPYAPDAKAFTLADVKRVLKIADYPVGFRDRLAAVSYRPIGVRQLRTLVANDAITPNELAERWQDNGFNPADSRMIADTMINEPVSQIRNAYRQGAKRRKIKCIQAAYDVGILDTATAGLGLGTLGLRDSDIVADLNAIDLCHITALVKESVRVTRSAYLGGEIDELEVSDRLSAAGIRADRIGTYLALWKVQWTAGVKRLRTGQILDLVRSGFLDDTTAALRLGRIGWADPDRMLLIAKADQQWGERQQRLADAAARKDKQRQAELDRVKKEALAQAKAAEAEMRREEPYRDLKKFFKDGLLSAGELADRMKGQGFTNEFIAWTINDLQRPAATKRAKAPATGG